jgi:hypothetical protein
VKKLYLLDCVLFVGQVFLDDKGEIIDYIHENDGDYRDEYMKPIINYFGGSIVKINPLLDVNPAILRKGQCDDINDVEDIIENSKKSILEEIIKTTTG